jgi:hypothetical protein
VPAGYVVDTRTRKGLWIPGVIMVGAPWALGLTIASGANFDNASGWLIAPVIGPWIMLATRDKSCGSGPELDCDSASDAVVRTWLVLDGLVQGTGAVMAYVGFTATKQELVRTDYLSLTVLPGPVGRFGYGANAVGRFLTCPRPSAALNRCGGAADNPRRRVRPERTTPTSRSRRHRG